jgi:hypothetical protein
MARFKIIRNNTNTVRKLLQARIETALVEEDVNLLVKWSNRDKNEIVAELLKYALSQEADFQAYKRSANQHCNHDMGKKPVESSRQSLPIAVSAR